MADCIIREAAIDAIWKPEVRPNALIFDALRRACEEEVKHIPAADVRPVVRARWEDETGYIFNRLAQRVYCPACKSYAYFYPITMKNFCPNCGADMRPERRTKE